MNLPEIIPLLKTGHEFFSIQQKKLNFMLCDFWAWNQSNLIENRTRGILAEFIIKQALNIKNETRTEWDQYDLITEKKIKIEVKSASYIQGWEQSQYSKITFGISKKLGENGNYKRWSDYYIFCLLYEKNQERINPLELNQWKFFVLKTKVLDKELGNQKTIGLKSLLKLNPIECSYADLIKIII